MTSTSMLQVNNFTRICQHRCETPLSPSCLVVEPTPPHQQARATAAATPARAAEPPPCWCTPCTHRSLGSCCSPAARTACLHQRRGFMYTVMMRQSSGTQATARWKFLLGAIYGHMHVACCAACIGFHEKVLPGAHLRWHLSARLPDTPSRRRRCAWPCRISPCAAASRRLTG